MSHADPIEIEAYVAGELAPSAGLLAHLDSCASCAESLKLAARAESALFDAADVSNACVACSRVVSADRCVGCGVAARVRGYVIERVLASGPVGRVYAARAANDVRVAVKELSFAGGPSADALASFEREATVLARLDHPSIPRFVDAFCEGQGTDARAYLVQELIDGAPLAELLGRHQFSEREIVDVLGQVLEVLAYLQSLTPMVFHRDVKPANLIRRENGCIALVDFGAARDLGATAGATVVGTFGYMQLEQMAGIVDATTDLHALGATAWHLATRIEPWRLWSDPALQKRSNLSPQLGRFLARLVAREPRRRFAGAAAAREALRNVHVDRRKRGVVRRWGAIAALSAGVSLTAVASVAVHEHKARVSWWHGVPIAISAPLPPPPTQMPPIPPVPAIPSMQPPQELEIAWQGWNGIIETRIELMRAPSDGVVLSMKVEKGDKVHQSAGVIVVLNKTTLSTAVAEYAGVVEQTFVKEGDTVRKDQAVARIVSRSAKDAVAEVGAGFVQRLRQGGLAEVGFNGKLFEGRVAEIGVIDPGRGTAQVRVHMSGDLPQVKPGARVAVSFR